MPARFERVPRWMAGQGCLKVRFWHPFSARGAQCPPDHVTMGIAVDFHRRVASWPLTRSSISPDGVGPSRPAGL